MSDRRQRLWFVVFVVAVFAAGIGAGSIADRLLRPGPGGGRSGGPAPFGLGGRGGGMGPGGLARTLGGELALTADQRTRLDGIIGQRRTRIEQIRSENRQKFEAEQQDFRAEIAKILTPDQQKRFDQWLEHDPIGLRVPGPGMGPGRGRGIGPGRNPGGRPPF